jgi:hypothetical protein
MAKSLAWARVFYADLLAECTAHGLSVRQIGILFSLLMLQHIRGGSIPADPKDLRRLIGEDALVDEIKQVIHLFFPITESGNRQNPQHANAQAEAEKVYQAQVLSGKITARKKRLARDCSPDGSPERSPGRSSASSATRSPGSNQNQNQNYNENQNSTEGIPWKKTGMSLRSTTTFRYHRARLSGTRMTRTTWPGPPTGRTGHECRTPTETPEEIQRRLAK